VQNINIYTRTHYTLESLNNIISNLDYMKESKELISIFSFEGTFVTLQEFYMLKRCMTGRILVLAENATIIFLASILSSERIKYIRLGVSFQLLKEEVKSLLNERYDFPVSFEKEVLSPSNLSLKEYSVLQLYIKGLSITQISKIFNLSVKTIYATKNHAMCKIGVNSDAGLLYNWDIINGLFIGFTL